MPRKSRGGSREGTPGTAYGNRTDLNMPISTVPGQAYGKQTQQREAQSAVPMGQSPVATPPMAQAPKPVTAPGSLPYLDATNRPAEPVTAGLPFGPGPGPEAMMAPRPNVSRQLASYADASGSELTMNIADAARMLGL